MAKLKEKLTHIDLVEIGRKWLSVRSPIVITEISACTEEPDVLGLESDIKFVKDRIQQRSFGITLLECKATKIDYKSDFKKSFRIHPSEGICKFRYYFTPEGLLDPEELPENWGLIEVTKKKIKIVKIAQPFLKHNVNREMTILVSLLRRLKLSEKDEHCSIRVYQTQFENSKKRATLTLTSGEGGNIKEDCNFIQDYKNGIRYRCYLYGLIDIDLGIFPCINCDSYSKIKEEDKDDL